MPSDRRKKASASRKSASPPKKRAGQPPESFAPDLRAYARRIHRRLLKEFGPVETPLHFQAPHELVIAVILSAQCTDEQVNRVTPELFRVFKRPQDFYEAPPEELERLIYSTGFYKNKARSIRAFCKQLVSDYNGNVPDTLDELVKMPGIGRKTANVVLNELHGKSEGIVVDTHVARISRVLKFTTQSDPVKIERDLMQAIPRKLWLDWALLIIFLGRKYCGARRRLCDQCPLNDICPSAEISK